MMLDTIHTCDWIVQTAGLLHDQFLFFTVFACFQTYIIKDLVVGAPLGEFHFSGILEAHSDQFLLLDSSIRAVYCSSIAIGIEFRIEGTEILTLSMSRGWLSNDVP